ncbi:hypothetical protein ACS0TY_012340 [Phlomoides rotata]
MAMGRRMSGGGGVVVVVLVVMAVVLTNAQSAQQIYQCWGGCYNVCFVKSSKSAAERFACYYQCLPGCVPRSPSNYQYFCQIGCALEQCRPIPYNDGARMEKCFGSCSNLCKG